MGTMDGADSQANQHGCKYQRAGVPKRFAQHHEIDPEADVAERAREKDEAFS
jgi:hypothetical protein